VVKFDPDADPWDESLGRSRQLGFMKS
jgi:hypothetical protein